MFYVYLLDLSYLLEEMKNRHIFETSIENENNKRTATKRSLV